MRTIFRIFGKKRNEAKTRRHFDFAKFFEQNSYYSQPKLNKITWVVILCLVPLVLSFSTLYFKVTVDPFIGRISPFVLVFIPILFSGLIGGFWPAIFATVIDAVGISYFFIPPYNSFALSNLKFFNIAIFLFEGVLTAIVLEARIRSMHQLKSRIEQQAAITQLEHFALERPDIQSIFVKAATLTTKTFNVKYCKILELLPGKKSFILRAGIGWRRGIVGHSIITAGSYSQGGYALTANKPVIVSNLKKEERFYAPELLISHGIVSGLSVIIPGKRGPYGILGVHSNKQRKFSDDDIYFVQVVANILATTIEKKSAEQALRNSQTRFKKLFNSNIVGAFIQDKDGTFLEANDALLALIQYSRKELHEGEIHSEIISAPANENIKAKVERDLKVKGKSQVYESTFISKSKNRIPVLVAVSRIDPQKNVCVGFVLDISKQKELEKRKDEFMSIASHELKTPVTTLKVLSQFLKRKFNNAHGVETYKYLDRMDKQIDKLTHLISDLLDITKIQAGKLELHKELFNLNDLVVEITEDIKAIDGEHNIILKEKFHNTVLADRDRIGQVLINLLTNAIKYSPKGKDIIITSKNKDQKAVVSVKDYGVGVDKIYLKKIFDQFFRVNNEATKTYPGFGMGLFISSEIIKRHNGEIWVESKKNKGSLFSFALPLTEGSYEKSN